MINNVGTRRRRWAATAAVIALTGVSVAACSSSSGGTSSAKEPQTITFAYSNPSGNEHYYQDAATANLRLPCQDRDQRNDRSQLAV